MCHAADIMRVAARLQRVSMTRRLDAGLENQKRGPNTGGRGNGAAVGRDRGIYRPRGEDFERTARVLARMLTDGGSRVVHSDPASIHVKGEI